MRCRHCAVEIEPLEAHSIYTGNPGYELVDAWIDRTNQTYCHINSYHEPGLPSISNEEAIAGLQGIVDDLT